MWYFSWILGVLLACSLGIINVLRLEAQEALAKEHEALDPLTHFLARESVLPRLREKVDNSKRNSLPFSIIYLSIRDFRIKHNLPEHEVDTTLMKAANIINDYIRPGVDLAARLNDDDFLVILPGSTDAKSEALGRKIQKKLAQDVKTPSNLPLEMAMGAAEFSVHKEAFSEDMLIGMEEVEALLNIAIAKSMDNSVSS